MLDFKPPHLTGDRLKKILAILQDAPRDPSCGCIMITETIRQVLEVLQKEEELATGGMAAAEPRRD